MEAHAAGNTGWPEHHHWCCAGGEMQRPATCLCMAQLHYVHDAAVATHYAQVVHPPDERHMAVLLGFAIGVMATVSIVELIVRNALEHDMFMVLGATILGGMVGGNSAGSSIGLPGLCAIL